MKNKNITFFFRAIHHIDPLHRKQTLILPLAILGISRTAPTETSRRARNVQDICLPTVFPAYKMHLVSPFMSEPRKVVKRQTMLVSSCIIVDKLCLFRLVQEKLRTQSNAKNSFSDFKTQSTIAKFDTGHGHHCRRDLQTAEQ